MRNRELNILQGGLRIVALVTEMATVSDIIAVRRLSKRYGNRTDAILALKDIDFTVPDGELLSIVGPSGYGKSTLLKPAFPG